jgi:hypothetical protein
MLSLQNSFAHSTGSDRIKTPLVLISFFCLILLSGWALSYFGLIAGIGFLIFPFVFVVFFFIFKYPFLGLYSTIILGFLLLGLGRYLTNLPIGLAMDGILMLTYLALFFSLFYLKPDWSPIKKDITFLALLWFGYSVFELFNPESRSLAASISGIRGVSLYMVLIIPLTLIFIDNQRKLNVIFYLWGFFSILASLKGIFQDFWGVDAWERAWLNEGGAVTHIINGKLRIFSFMSDAGQFGANQAYSAVMATIILFVENNWRKRIFFLLVALLGFYGMFLSGTRGAISIPFAGFAIFLILRKNWPILISGFLLIMIVFVFFKFTYIGQGHQSIRRMRTAFDLNDPSFQVRLENQQKLKVYLASRPFGGGIGHSGVKAQRYLPNAFLSNVPTDSWYVMIWAEQGIIGLLLHLFILFYVILKSSYMIMFRIRDPILKMKIAALTSGMFGIMVASYGNAVLGTMPTSILIYTSMALMLNSEKFDTPLIVKTE